MKNNLAQKVITMTLILIGVLLVGCTDKTQQMIKNSVEELNKQCPIQIDEITRLDSSEALPNHTLKYNYTILFMSAAGIDSSRFKKDIQPSILYNIQTNVKMQPARDAKIAFVYTYKDDKGTPLGTITISPDDYNQPAVKPQPFDISTTYNNQDTDTNLQAMIAGIQKQLPIEVPEQNMSVVGCDLVGKKVIRYTYQFHNESASKFDTVQFKNTTTQTAIESLRQNAAMKSIADNGVTINYLYKDKNGNYLCSINITADSFK